MNILDSQSRNLQTRLILSIPFQPRWFLFLFVCFITLFRTASTILNRNGKSGQSWSQGQVFRICFEYDCSHGFLEYIFKLVFYFSITNDHKSSTTKTQGIMKGMEIRDWGDIPASLKYSACLLHLPQSPFTEVFTSHLYK